MLDDVLAGYKDEHKELSETWKQLETKAQGNTTVCGVFLAGVFAFAREVTDGSSELQLALLTVATALLVISVVYALLAVHVRKVLSSPHGKAHADLVADLFKISEHEVRWENYLSDQITLWKNANASLGKANEQKARRVRIAQWILVCAIACAAGVTGLTIWPLA